MKNRTAHVSICLLATLIAASLTAGPARAATYSVELAHLGYNYPSGDYVPPFYPYPFRNPAPIGTGGAQQFAMFNPTTGYLTQVDMSFSYSSGYSGRVRNMSSSNSVPDAYFTDTGTKTSRFYFMPTNSTMWTHTSGSDGRTNGEYLSPRGTSWYLKSPIRSYGSGTYTITDPNNVRLFVGIGNDRSLIQAHVSNNYKLTTSSANLWIDLWQYAFFPRGWITYTYTPFPTIPAPAGGGLSFSVAEAPSYGQGQVEPTPLGSMHKHKVQAFSGQAAVTENTGLRQQFTFTREDMGNEQTEVFINGLLDGFLSADNNGVARALGVIELYNSDDELINRVERLAFADSQTYFGTSQEENVHELFGMNVLLLPGHVYELRSELYLTADPRGAGTALADFSNTFAVEISGVPEPTTLVLLLLVGPALMRRKRK